MDTVGSMIDKMFTINMKTHFNINKDKTDVLKVNNLIDQRLSLEKELDDAVDFIMKFKPDDKYISKPQHKTY